MNKQIAKYLAISLFAAAFGISAPVRAATTDLATQPMAVTSNTVVKPNLLFLLDDSGSMAWDRLSPDTMANTNSNTNLCYMNTGYNGLYYNPASTYVLPLTPTGTNYPNTTFTNAKDNGFATSSVTYSNLSSAFKTGGSSNNSISLIGGVVTASTAGGPAFYYVYRATAAATITVGGSTSTTTSITGITVGGKQIMSAASTPSTSTSAVASSIASKINACTNAVTGNCTVSGYVAQVSGSTIKVYGPVTAASSTPVIAGLSGSMTITPNAFASDGTPTTPATGTCYPDVNYTQVVVTSASAEAQNFANWYSYYRTRMQAMKSAVGRAFGPIDSTFRVGFTRINSITSGTPVDVNISDFDAAQKSLFYTSFYSVVPNSSTPLRVALADAGRIFAHTLAGAADPMQYSCQQNFTIMTTDGMWNDPTNPKQVDGATDIGNQDSVALRPMYDGSSYTQTNTQKLKSTTTVYANTSQLMEQQLQSSTSNLQKSTMYLQKSTRVSGTWGAYAYIGPSGTCTWGNNTRCRYTTTSGGSTVWTAGAGTWAITSSTCATSFSTTTTNGTGWTGDGTSCQYTSWGAWANAASCAPLAQSTASPYTVTTATQCQSQFPVSSCPGGATCTTNTTSTAVASCTPSTASSANNWTTTTCPPATVTPWVGVSSCTTASASSSNGYVATNCNTVTNSATVLSCTAASASAGNNWTSTSCSAPTGGASNTLADVAYYYWTKDLRDSTLSNCTGALGTDVCFNNVRGTGFDVNQQQHMTTFTLGLGVVGTLDPTNYYPYPPSGSTDFQNIYTGPNNWPVPVSNSNTTVDDLWHAAVNGRGQYFSAKDPDSLVQGLTSALEGVKKLKGASAAASTSNMQPVPGDSYAYIALFDTLAWDGDLIAKEIDPITGQFVQDPATNSDKIDWQAQPQLDAMTAPISDTRTIYTFDSSVTAAANKLKPFTWASLTAAEQAYFNNMCGATPLLSQCSTLIANDTTNGTATAAAASGANLVNFLRGQRGFEDVSGNNGVVYSNGTTTWSIYRPRAHVLGDIVSAQPQYVKKPPFSYADAGYATFVAAQTNRIPMVYSGANDGMLHAFDAATGTERWAYIPSLMLPSLYHLASEDYPNNHRYYVDGTPTVADICPTAPTTPCTASQWKTILVGGFNDGGRGFYALDITDPLNPKALWNYSVTDQSNMGYSYGNPVIVKRKDNCSTLSGVTTCEGGTWVVGITSGYNNVSPGDGQGHLFILNAYTGAQLEDIVATDSTTSAFTGDTGTPSGLSRIDAFVANPVDNTAEHFYGGDLLGNFWRLSIDSVAIPSGKGSFLLAQLGKVDLSNFQPVTIRPELAEIVDTAGATHTIIEIATGRYLGVSDLANTDQQSIYSFKDDMSTTPLGLVRTSGKLVKQTLTTYTSGGNSYRKGTSNAVDWTTTSGWYVDLNPNGDSPGERVNVDMNQQQTTLQVTANVPNNNACNVGGYSWIYYFNYSTGFLAPLAGIKDATNSMIAGTTQIMDQTGKTHTIITHTDGTVTVQDDVSPPPVLGVSRRTSWRELTY